MGIEMRESRRVKPSSCVTPQSESASQDLCRDAREKSGRLVLCRGPDLNRHGPCGPQDFKSCASTSSVTPARGQRSTPHRRCHAGRSKECLKETRPAAKYSTFGSEKEAGGERSGGEGRIWDVRCGMGDVNVAAREKRREVADDGLPITDD